MASWVRRMCRCWQLPPIELSLSLSLRGGIDIGTQSGCHHQLEKKSVTGAPHHRHHHLTIMYKRTYRTQTLSCHTHAPCVNLCLHRRSNAAVRWWWHYPTSYTRFKWKYRFWAWIFQPGLWIASETFAALLRVSCLQCEVCHGWFSSTGGDLSARERDYRHVFGLSVCPREEASTVKSDSTNAT